MSRMEAAIRALVAKYGCPMGLARHAVEAGIHAKAGELADRDADPARAFVAAVQALTTRRAHIHRAGVTP